MLNRILSLALISVLIWTAPQAATAAKTGATTAATKPAAKPVKPADKIISGKPASTKPAAGKTTNAWKTSTKARIGKPTRAVAGKAARGAKLGKQARLQKLAPPPPPRPAPIAGANSVMAAASRGDWAGITALAAAATAAGQPHAAALADFGGWVQLTENRGQSAGELLDGMRRYAGFPGVAQLRERVEENLPEETPAADVIAIFADTPPQTHRGMRLLSAAYAAQGRVTEAEALLRKGWLAHGLDSAEQARWLAAHGEFLAPLHAARLDALLWKDRLAEAEAMLDLVTPPQKSLAEARIALIRGRAGVDERIAALPTELQNDPGLNFDRLRWHERRGRRAEAESLLRAANTPELMRNAAAWAHQRKVMARDAAEEGRYQEAYSLAAAHHLTTGADFSDLEFMAGWLALRKLGNPRVAFGHFERLWNGSTTPITRARAAYWAGRAAAALSEEEAATQWYQRAATYPTSYYGQLAAERLALKPSRPTGVQLPPPRPDATQQRMLAIVPLLEDHPTLQQRFLRQAALHFANPTEGLTLAGQLNAPNLAIHVVKNAIREGKPLAEPLRLVGGWPIWPNMPAQLSNVDPALVLAIMRQESEMDPRAGSPVGAQGLMQLMPATARHVARAEGLALPNGALKADPTLNIRLGSAYLRELLDSFDGSLPMAIAAYNAGPGRVVEWKNRFGDPRDPNTDAIDWIESIPFNETRNYVQRVTENLQIYRLILATQPPETWQISRDING